VLDYKKKGICKQLTLLVLVISTSWHISCICILKCHICHFSIICITLGKKCTRSMPISSNLVGLFQEILPIFNFQKKVDINIYFTPDYHSKTHHCFTLLVIRKICLMHSDSMCTYFETVHSNCEFICISSNDRCSFSNRWVVLKEKNVV
jgi:hypothetical protein